MSTQTTCSSSSPGIEALLEELRREVEYDRLERRKELKVGLLLCLAITLCTAGRFWAIGKSQELQVLSILLMGTFQFGGIAIGGVRLRRYQGRKQARFRLMNSLAQEARAAGMLTHMAQRQIEEVSAAAKSVLNKLLPRLRTGDERWFSPKQMTSLINLARSSELNLVCAILKALEQIGDSRALPIVEQLAASSPYPQVCASATECLPYLRLRVEQQEKAMTLLRPSGPDATMPESLLRAATNDIATPPEQLLRTVE